MAKLLSIKPGEKFLYKGDVCIIDETGTFGGRQVPVRSVDTGAKFLLPTKTDVEKYPEPDFIEEEIDEVEEVDDYILVEDIEEEDTEDEAPF